MAERKRPRRQKMRAKSRKLLPDADEIPNMLDDLQDIDACLGGPAK